MRLSQTVIMSLSCVVKCRITCLLLKCNQHTKSQLPIFNVFINVLPYNYGSECNYFQDRHAKCVCVDVFVCCVCMVVGDGGTGKIERLSGATKDGVMPMSQFTCTVMA